MAGKSSSNPIGAAARAAAAALGLFSFPGSAASVEQGPSASVLTQMWAIGRETFYASCASAPYWLLAFVLVNLIGLAYLLISLKIRSPRELLRQLFPSEIYNSTESHQNSAHFAINIFLLTPFLVGALSIFSVVGLGNLFANSLGEGLHLISNPTAVLAAQFVITVLLGDLIGYLMHYLAHRYKLLWSSHRSHHSSEVMSIFVGRRETFSPAKLIEKPIELILQGMASAFAIYVTGGAAIPDFFTLFVSYKLGLLMLTLYQHMHLPVSFGVLDYILVSPAAHHLHHSAEYRHWEKNYGCNYGNIFSFWDRMFGTFIEPQPDDAFRFGINENEIGANNPHNRMIDLYIEPTIYFWRALKSYFPARYVGPHGKGGSLPFKKCGDPV